MYMYYLFYQLLDVIHKKTPLVIENLLPVELKVTLLSTARSKISFSLVNVFNFNAHRLNDLEMCKQTKIDDKSQCDGNLEVFNRLMEYLHKCTLTVTP